MGKPKETNTEGMTDKASKIYTVTRSATLAAGALGGNIVESIVMMMVAAGGSLGVVGGMLSNNTKSPEDPVSADEMLFAAILVSVANPGTDGDRGIMAFDPSVIYDAMEMFERATGRKPDTFMIPAMAEAARSCAAQGAEALAKFQQERAAGIELAKRGDAKLN
jgi:hypothetical protein